MPDSVDFGKLKEGLTYSFSVYIKNIGVDSCRYKIRSPPLSTGLRLIYVPGPVSSLSPHRAIEHLERLTGRPLTVL